MSLGPIHRLGSRFALGLALLSCSRPFLLDVSHYPCLATRTEPGVPFVFLAGACSISGTSPNEQTGSRPSTTSRSQMSMLGSIVPTATKFPAAQTLNRSLIKYDYTPARKVS